MILIPFVILALAAGVYLLIQVRISGIGPMYRNLSWLVIVLSLLCILGGVLHGIHHLRHIHQRQAMGHCDMDRKGGDCPYMQGSCCTKGADCCMKGGEANMKGADCCMHDGKGQMGGMGQAACCKGDSAAGHAGCSMMTGSKPACCMAKADSTAKKK